MKHNKNTLAQTQRTSPVKAPVEPLLMSRAADFAPAPDEVARRAYFSYVNQGSRSGHEVQHWLAAEAEMIAERNLTRTHGFHNPT